MRRRACMFAAYAMAQLPEGVALDLLGPRRVQAAGTRAAIQVFVVTRLAGRRN